MSDLFDSSESIMNPLPLQKPEELNYDYPTGTLAQERPWLNRRKQNKRVFDIENALLWRGILLSKDTGRPIYSEKVSAKPRIIRNIAIIINFWLGS